MLFHRRILSQRRFGLVAAALLWLAAPLAGRGQAEDWVWANREMAKTAALHHIAVIQAMAGDFQGAKRTASQIDWDDPKGPSEVTVVSFCNGQPIYHCRQPAGCGFPPRAEVLAAPRTPGWGNHDSRGVQYFLAADRAVDRVPAQPSAGLPSDYLAGDPRHGALVDFSDQTDSHGTRVTARRYADGHVVIETPAGY